MAFSKCISGNDGKLSCTPQPPGTAPEYTRNQPHDSFDPGYSGGRGNPNGYYPWEMPEWNQHGNYGRKDPVGKPPRGPVRANPGRPNNPKYI